MNRYSKTDKSKQMSSSLIVCPIHMALSYSQTKKY